MSDSLTMFRASLPSSSSAMTRRSLWITNPDAMRTVFASLLSTRLSLKSMPVPSRRKISPPVPALDLALAREEQPPTRM